MPKARFSNCSSSLLGSSTRHYEATCLCTLANPPHLSPLCAYWGFSTIPSYCRLAMFSRVWLKCFLMFSSPAVSWFTPRFEWMSSISPLMYFVVTWQQSLVYSAGSKTKHRNPYRFVLLVEVVHITVEDLDKELYRRRLLHARVRDPQGTLQAFQHALAVPVELETAPVS